MLPGLRVLSDANTEECDDDVHVQSKYVPALGTSVGQFDISLRLRGGFKECKVKIKLSPAHAMMACWHIGGIAVYLQIDLL